MTHIEKTVWILGTFICTCTIGYLFLKIAGGYIVTYGYDIVADILNGTRFMIYIIGSFIIIEIFKK